MPSPLTPLPRAGEGEAPVEAFVSVSLRLYNATDASGSKRTPGNTEDDSPSPARGRGALGRRPQPRDQLAMGRGVRVPLLLSAAALLLAALPYVAGFTAAPRGMAFLGALNNVGDTGQYLAAIRQGGGGQLLYTNQYSSLRVAPVLMYPFYTAAGLLLSPLGLPAMAVYQVLHLLAAVALLGALWRFCRVALPSAPPVLPYALAICGGGLYAPALLLSGLAHLPFAPAALTAPEFSAFATLLISPHGAAGLAAQLWALAGYLGWRRQGHGRDLLALALGGLALGLCYPFGIVALVAVVAVDAAIRIALSPPNEPTTKVAWQTAATKVARARQYDGPSSDAAKTHTFIDRHFSVRGLPCDFSRRLRGELAGDLSRRRRGEFLLALALLPATGVALYYAVLFHHDPLWGGSNMLRLPPPDVAVLVAAFGPLLALALPIFKLVLAKAYHGVGGAGLRLVAVWAVASPLLVLTPLPQTERLLEGWSVALALLGAVTVRQWRPRAAVRAVAALSASNIVLVLLYLVIAARGANPGYYAPVDELRAAGWLGAHTEPDDVVMASAGSGNLIVAAAPCHVVVGQNFETFDWAAAQRDVLRYYGGATGVDERATIVRRLRVTFVVDGPYEQAVGSFMPGRPGYRLVHRDGAVRVFAVAGA